MSPQPELIRGGLKYVWREGRSRIIDSKPAVRLLLLLLVPTSFTSTAVIPSLSVRVTTPNLNKG